MKKGKEVNSVIYNTSLNVGYLPKEDLYVYKPEEPKYKINVIGAGMMAMEHIKVTHLEGRAEVNGFFDTSPHSTRIVKELFAQHFPDKKLTIYDSLEAACNDPNVDALLIATPNFSHIDVVREAVKSKKHIYLEKPMATTVDDALEIRQLAKDYPNVFQVGLQYRYKAIYTETRKSVLELKELGDVKTITILEHRLPFLDKINQWNKFSEYSGGTLVEKCCHYFDLFNLFSQSKPKSVFATADMAVNFKDFEKDGKKSDIVDNAIVTVIYENGVKANFNLCMFAPMFYEEIVVCGEQGRIKAYENEDYLPIPRPATHFEITTADHGTSRISTPCYPTTIQTSGHMGGTYFSHKYFVDAMDGKDIKVPNVDEGLWSVLIGIAAEQSAKTGEIVHISDLLKDKKL